MSTRRGGSNADPASIYNLILELRSELSALKSRVDEMDRRLSERIERLERLVELNYRRRVNDAIRWAVVLVALVLSWLAAIMGVGWVPTVGRPP